MILDESMVRVLIVKLFTENDPEIRKAVQVFLRKSKTRGRPVQIPMNSMENCLLTYARLARYSWEIHDEVYAAEKERIKKLKENGVQVKSEYVDLHYRLAAPWQGLVMMLITIPLLAQSAQRKAIALHVLVCVGIIFIYHVTGAIGLALGKASKLFPFASAWVGNVIFTVGALMHIDRANH